LQTLDSSLLAHGGDGCMVRKREEEGEQHQKIWFLRESAVTQHYILNEVKMFWKN
jgi:hypothetical protein